MTEPAASIDSKAKRRSQRSGGSKRWWPFLRWPLMSYRDEVDLTLPDGGLSKIVDASRFPLRLQRYWWVARQIDDEASSVTPDPLVVVDLGCERGWLKRFTPRRDNIEWVGLDGNVSHPSLEATGYQGVRLCNFNERLPLPDGSADVVVSLHVFEHLPNPAFTLGEVARVLKPGGIFLGGSPTAPSPVSWIRSRMLRHRQRTDRRRHWGHVQSMSPAGWHQLCSDAGLTPEFVTGSHFIRRTGSWLEGRGWWVRLNQLWGALFPSLGSEAYIACRKRSTRSSVVLARAERLWLRTDWLVPVAACVLLAIAIVRLWTPSPSFGAEIARHQDGNDVFAICPLTATLASDRNADLAVVPSLDAVEGAFTDHARSGHDLHLIVHAEHLDAYLSHANARHLRVADQWQHGRDLYLVLSVEDDRPSLSDYASRL